MNKIIIGILFLVASVLSQANSQVLSEPLKQETYEDKKQSLGFHKTKRILVPRENEEDQEEEVEHVEREPSINSPNLGIASGFVKIISIVLIAILIGALLYILFSNVKIDKKMIPVPELEDIEDIEEIDAVSYYDQAVQNGDYRLALRMQFIKALQLLSQKEYIVWKNDKTNRDYIREISDRAMKNDFREIALIYEKVWYGNLEIDLTTFKELDKLFLKFLNNYK